MPAITSLKEANQLLAQFVPRKRAGAYTLDRMFKLMELLGNPQEQVKIIHIAGTAGKTSTSYFVAEMLKLAGKNVGLTVSPHVNDVNDRVQINGSPLPENRFCELLTEFISIDGLTELEPTYFELLVSFAYWTFAKEQVDYAVIEVGLGGLLDGTNVVKRSDKVCVITDIGLDHTHVLGNKITEIASQKAGIIQSDNQVFMLKQSDEIIATVSQYADKQQARLTVCEQLSDAPNTLPSYQQRNWQLSKAVFDYVAQRDGLEILSQAQVTDSAIQVPGRLEHQVIEGKDVYFDGAHNVAKFTALVNSLPAGQRFTVVIGMIETKEMQLADCIKLLVPVTAKLVSTSFPAKQDLPHQAIAPNKVAAAAKLQGVADVVVEEDANKALKLALEGDNPVLVTGSFYLISYLKGANWDD